MRINGVQDCVYRTRISSKTKSNLGPYNKINKFYTELVLGFILYQSTISINISTVLYCVISRYFTQLSSEIYAVGDRNRDFK